jgi:hypothetical protein
LLSRDDSLQAGPSRVCRPRNRPMQILDIAVIRQLSCRRVCPGHVGQEQTSRTNVNGIWLRRQLRAIERTLGLVRSLLGELACHHSPVRRSCPEPPRHPRGSTSHDSSLTSGLVTRVARERSASGSSRCVAGWSRPTSRDATS